MVIPLTSTLTFITAQVPIFEVVELYLVTALFSNSKPPQRSRVMKEETMFPSIIRLQKQDKQNPWTNKWSWQDMVVDKVPFASNFVKHNQQKIRTAYVKVELIYMYVNPYGKMLCRTVQDDINTIQ